MTLYIVGFVPSFLKFLCNSIFFHGHRQRRLIIVPTNTVNHTLNICFYSNLSAVMTEPICKRTIETRSIFKQLCYVITRNNNWHTIIMRPTQKHNSNYSRRNKVARYFVFSGLSNHNFGFYSIYNF